MSHGRRQIQNVVRCQCVKVSFCEPNHLNQDFHRCVQSRGLRQEALSREHTANLTTHATMYNLAFEGSELKIEDSNDDLSRSPWFRNELTNLRSRADDDSHATQYVGNRMHLSNLRKELNAIYENCQQSKEFLRASRSTFASLLPMCKSLFNVAHIVMSINMNSKMVWESTFQGGIPPTLHDIIQYFQSLRGESKDVMYFQNVRYYEVSDVNSIINFTNFYSIPILDNDKIIAELMLMDTTIRDNDFDPSLISTVQDHVSQIIKLQTDAYSRSTSFREILSESVRSPDSKLKHQIRTSLTSLTLSIQNLKNDLDISRAKYDKVAMDVAMASCANISRVVDDSFDVNISNPTLSSPKGNGMGRLRSFSCNAIMERLQDEADLPSTPENSINMSLIELYDLDIESFDATVRVLIVEDSVSIQMMLSKYLRRVGCEVDVSSNGLEGYNLMKTMNYDIIITDFVMPIMGGIEMLERFSSYRNVNDKPQGFIYSPKLILGMSATANESDIHLATSYGMDAFMSKPINHSTLDVFINLIKKKKGHQ